MKYCFWHFAEKGITGKHDLSAPYFFLVTVMSENVNKKSRSFSLNTTGWRSAWINDLQGGGLESGVNTGSQRGWSVDQAGARLPEEVSLVVSGAG